MSEYRAPSEDEVAELRLEGNCLYSPLAAHFLATIVLLLTLFFISSDIKRIFVDVFRAETLALAFKNVSSELTVLFLLPVAAFSATYFLVSLVQTKFLCKLHFLSMRSSRFKNQSKNLTLAERFLWALAEFSFQIFIIAHALVFALLLINYLYVSFEGLLEASGKQSAVLPFPNSLFLLLLGELALFAVFSWLIARWKFKKIHRVRNR